MRRMQGNACTALGAGETKVGGCYAHHSPQGDKPMCLEKIPAVGNRGGISFPSPASCLDAIQYRQVSIGVYSLCFQHTRKPHIGIGNLLNPTKSV